MTFKFSYTDTDEWGEVVSETSVELSTDEWTTATRHFIYFLRGAGFVVSEEELEKFIQEAMREYEAAIASPPISTE